MKLLMRPNTFVKTKAKEQLMFQGGKSATNSGQPTETLNQKRNHESSLGRSVPCGHYQIYSR